MPTPKKNLPKEALVKGHTVGRARFTKISEVEGITVSTAMRKRARSSTDQGLSAEEARRLIIRAYRKS
ncbi:hypothetical protein [Bradyrhizobium sp. 2TAF24]|uniref:hypothetical protein n=1 Tax=Bradyrhizobium sp. 2TAF24 TaxID=3233011 RepID=UPI003F8F481B